VVDESHSLLPRDTQASLANYQYHLDTQSNPRVLAANSAISVRSLEFLLVQPIDFSNADRLLGYTTSVDNVAISIDKYAAAVRMNMTTNDMFNALFHATEGIPSRRLRLQGITFEADDLPAVLPLGRVEYLHMIDCENIGHFHANFSARRLAEHSRRDESSNFHTVGARPDGHSSGFITPLRTFHIMSSTLARGTFFYPVSWLSFCEHASELECLERTTALLYVQTHRRLIADQRRCSILEQFARMHRAWSSSRFTAQGSSLSTGTLPMV
jgi:hypothetical protein